MEKVYVTKYALTEGILEAEVEHRSGNYVYVKTPHGLNGMFQVHAKDALPSQVAAELRFETLRRNRIANLQKQIEKLEKLKPKVKVWT